MSTSMKSPKNQLSAYVKCFDSKTVPEPTPELAWDVLDQFAQNLQSEQETRGQIKLSLRAIRKALRADLVYWDPGQSEESPICSGSTDVTASWCQQLTKYLLAETPGVDGQLLRSQMQGTRISLQPQPQSTAMVRISRSQNSWITAVNFETNRAFQPIDAQVIGLARRLLLNHRHNLHAHESLRQTLFGMIRCLTAAIDAKDPYTCGHSERVARIAQRLGHQLGHSASMLSDLYLAGLLHDIGKIGIPDSLLRKPGPLTDDERISFQEHTLIGDRMISSIKHLKHLRSGIRSHHERVDGEGYPDKIGGDELHVLPRILAVADSCDAMMSDRPYRRALNAVRIESILSDGAGSQWDEQVISAFFQCRTELYSICQRGLGESVARAVAHAIQLEPPPFLASRAALT